MRARVCVLCVYWLRRARVKRPFAPPASATVSSLCLRCLSDAGDGGQAVRGLLEFLRLCGGGFRDGAKAEWQSNTTGADVAGAQRWILPSIAFHNAGGVGCKAFTRPAQQDTKLVSNQSLNLKQQKKAAM